MSKPNAALTVSYERLGDVTQRLDQSTEAQDFYRQAVAICERLAEADPKNAQAQRDLGVSYNVSATCCGGRDGSRGPGVLPESVWRSAGDWPMRTRRIPSFKMT